MKFLFRPFLRQFVKKSRQTGLNQQELEHGRAKLQAFLQENMLTVRKALAGRQLWQLGGFLPMGSFLKQRAMPIVAIMLAVMLAGGGVSFAAEQSLPGDALYPVKVSVNEEVREAFTLRQEAKAEWQIRRAERRLEEAEQLSVDGKLDAETRERIEVNFEKHIVRIRERVKMFEEKNDLRSATDVSARFETALQAHADVLAKLAEKRNGDTQAMKEKVDEEEDEAGDDHRAATQRVKNDDDSEEKREQFEKAAENKMNAALKKIEEVKEHVQKLLDNGKISAETSSEAKVELVNVEKLITDAKAQVANGEYREAFLSFQEAHNKAQRVKLLVEAEKNLSVRVKIDEDKDEREERKQEEKRQEQLDDDEDEDSDEDEDESADDEDEDSDEDDDEEDDSDEDKIKSEINAQGLRLRIEAE